jgi:hypothetical protein
MSWLFGNLPPGEQKLADVPGRFPVWARFDTATEIGVLGISAASASNGMSVWSIMIFPALFASGMALWIPSITC